MGFVVYGFLFHPSLRLSQSHGTLVTKSGFNSRQGLGFFFLPPRSNRPWGPPSLLANRYRGVERPGLYTDLHLVRRLWIHGAIRPFPTTSSWRGAKLDNGHVFLAYRQVYLCHYYSYSGTRHSLSAVSANATEHGVPAEVEIYLADEGISYSHARDTFLRFESDHSPASSSEA
jgi:hypothetical protein